MGAHDICIGINYTSTVLRPPYGAFSYPHFDLATSVLSQPSKGLSTPSLSNSLGNYGVFSKSYLLLLPFTLKGLDFICHLSSKTKQIRGPLCIPPSPPLPLESSRAPLFLGYFSSHPAVSSYFCHLLLLPSFFFFLLFPLLIASLFTLLTYLSRI